MPDEANHPLPTPPLIVVPATGFGVQPTLTHDGTPAVMVQMSNAVVHCNFPMDLEQAAQHAEDVQRAILEARGLSVPGKQKLHRV